MKLQSIALLVLIVLALFAPVSVWAQEPDATQEAPVVVEEVEAAPGDVVEVDTTGEGTTVIEVVPVDDVQPWEAENAELFGLVLILAAIGAYYVIDRFFGKEVKPYVDQVRPIVISVRDTAMERAQEYVEGTPGKLDDKAFQLLADELGYDVTKKAQG